MAQTTTRTSTNSGAFTCEACGKSYPWKQKLAGKKVRCKCGQVMVAPATAPVADDSGSYDVAEDDLVADEIPALDNKQRKCGSCGRPLDDTAVICVSCGMDFRTGRKVAPGSTSPAASATPGAANPFGIPAASRPVVSHERSAAPIIKLLVGVCVVIGVCVAAVAGLQMIGGGEDLSLRHVEDQEAIKKMNELHTQEAMDWLTGSNRTMLSGMTDQQAERRIQTWYDMGAKQVFAFGAGMSLTVVLELPDDPDQREALFDWRKDWYAGIVEIAHPDEGQQYMVVALKL